MAFKLIKRFSAVVFVFITLLGVFQIGCMEQSQTSDRSTENQISSTSETNAQSPSFGDLPALEPRYNSKQTFDEYVEVTITAASAEAAGLQLPAYVKAEVAANQSTEVYWLVGSREGSDTRRLLEITPVMSRDHRESSPQLNLDSNEYFKVWYTEASYLSDRADGDFVVSWTNGLEDDQLTINGLYFYQGSAEPVEAILSVDLKAGLSSLLTSVTSGEEIKPTPGDQFQLIDLFLVENGRIISRPGKKLTFNESGSLSYERRVLNSGDYFLGLKAETIGGVTTASYANFLVSNDTLQGGQRSYFDPIGGFQFLYPENWRETTVRPDLTLIQDDEGYFEVRLTRHPDLNTGSINALKDEALQIFGGVQILYEDRINLGSTGALRTAYSYDAEDGSHTGILLVFAHEGAGYVIDFDAVLTDDQELLEKVAQIVDSWVERVSNPNFDPGNWEEVTYQDLTMLLPTDFRRVALGNGWDRLDPTSRSGFIAFRSEITEQPLTDRLLHWLEVASGGVSEFNYSMKYEMPVNGALWTRYDFTYVDSNSSTIEGSLMGSTIDDEYHIFWTEAPSPDISLFEEQVLSIILASIQMSTR